MKLSIFSLQKTLYQGEALAINCKTSSGEITALDNHRPLISVLSPGVIRVSSLDKKDAYFQISSGFLEIKANNEARLLVEE